jgi:hypothetical protein
VHLKYENGCEIGSSYFEIAHRLPRWKKCQSLVDKFVNELINVKHKLDENERKETLNRVFEHDKFQLVVPNYAHKAKDVERLHTILENVKYTLLKHLPIGVVKTWFVIMQFFLLLFLTNMALPNLFSPKK